MVFELCDHFRNARATLKRPNEPAIADAEKMDQLARRQVRPTRQHNEEVRELLKLMGIPCVIVSAEAMHL